MKSLPAVQVSKVPGFKLYRLTKGMIDSEGDYHPKGTKFTTLNSGMKDGTRSQTVTINGVRKTFYL